LIYRPADGRSDIRDPFEDLQTQVPWKAESFSAAMRALRCAGNIDVCRTEGASAGFDGTVKGVACSDSSQRELDEALF
jgi:hypothetical protein